MKNEKPGGHGERSGAVAAMDCEATLLDAHDEDDDEHWSNAIVASMTPTERDAWQDLWSGLQPVTTSSGVDSISPYWTS